MKKWRLTKQAELSLLDIAKWTVENFGKTQAFVYRDALISRINNLASDTPPLGKSCRQLLQDKNELNNLFYYFEGKHYIVYRINKNNIDILDFFHERSDLIFHIKKLSSK